MMQIDLDLNVTSIWNWPTVAHRALPVEASNTLVALKEAGIENVRMYFGSWNEWSRNARLPIEEGPPDPMPPRRIAPIDRTGLLALASKGKADPTAVRTVKCRTVLEGKFRHLNYIRNLPAHVVDEPPVLLGDDTAPNPTEALLAALGSCVSVGIHAGWSFERQRLPAGDEVRLPIGR
jgi:hypothetical protein